MSKKDTPETPKSGPRHFGETLPDLKAEQGKKLPTGSAKLIAIEAAKEIGKLGYDLVKSGGLLTPVKLVTMAWTAWRVYSTAKAEALRKLNETYLTGRDVWAQDIMGNVEGGEFNVSGNEPVKQDIRDFLHGTSPAPSSPLRLQVRTQYRKQKEYEAVVAHLEQLEQGAAVIAESLSANPPEQSDVAARTEELKASLTQGEQALTTVAATTEETDAAVPPVQVGTRATGKYSETLNKFVRRHTEYRSNPVDKLHDIVSHVAGGYDVPLPNGLKRTPCAPPSSYGGRGEDTFSVINGVIEHHGVRIIFDGIVVDYAGSWWNDKNQASKLTITSSGGTIVTEHHYSTYEIYRPGQAAGELDAATMNEEFMQAIHAVSGHVDQEHPQ